jgi:hypothetical protein
MRLWRKIHSNLKAAISNQPSKHQPTFDLSFDLKERRVSARGNSFQSLSASTFAAFNPKESIQQCSEDLRELEPSSISSSNSQHQPSCNLTY